MENTNLTLEEIYEKCSELDRQILDLYLKRVTQKNICEQLNIKRGKIDTLVKKYKLTRFRDRSLYTINKDCLNVNNENIWYYLGLFASDGSLTTTNSSTQLIQFTMDDIDVLEHIKEILGYTGEIRKYNKLNKDRYMLWITTKELIEFTNNIFGDDCHNKTNKIKYPTFPNENCKIMFLRGFIDGDGSFRKTGDTHWYRFNIYCNSYEFILKLKDDIAKIIEEEPGFYNNNTIEISSKEKNYKLYKFLYFKINNKYYMKRKFDRAVEHITAYENEID